MLQERGCNMIEPLKEDDASAEITSNEIRQRMVTKRFKVPKRVVEWLDEYKTFFRTDTTVPRDSHPLMAATRYAVAQITWARQLRAKGKKQINHPRLAMI
jgi:pyruvate carboxylase